MCREEHPTDHYAVLAAPKPEGHLPPSHQMGTHYYSTLLLLYFLLLFYGCHRLSGDYFRLFLSNYLPSMRLYLLFFHLPNYNLPIISFTVPSTCLCIRTTYSLLLLLQYYYWPPHGRLAIYRRMVLRL